METIRPVLRTARKNPVRLANMDEFYRFTYEYYYKLYQHFYPLKRSGVIMTKLPAMPRGCSVAGTEMGIAGVSFPNHSVIDMVGLNNPGLVFSPNRDVISMIMKKKPDLIIMPHQGYRELNRRLITHPVFRTEYLGISPLEAVLPLGLALRKSGPCHLFFRGVLRETGLNARPSPLVFPDLKSLYPFPSPVREKK